MSESLVNKWRKIPLGAGAVVAGMCADELAARDVKIRTHLKRLKSVFGFWQPADIEELNAALALLDGQPDEGHGYMGLGHG